MAITKILVVDDDPDILDYFSSFLEDNGYTVQVAHQATSALERISSFVPDVVLIDVLMPERSGLDLLVNLRRDPRWSMLPLIVVTGNDRILEDDCQTYLSTRDDVRGPDGVLAKPVDRDALLSTLKKLEATSSQAEQA